MADDRTPNRANTTANIGVRIVSREYPLCLKDYLVGVVAVIAPERATASGASALAGTSPSIQTRTNARIAVGLAYGPPVATPESSRLDWLMIDRSWWPMRSISTCRTRIAFNYGPGRFRRVVCGMAAVCC